MGKNLDPLFITINGLAVKLYENINHNITIRNCKLKALCETTTYLFEWLKNQKSKEYHRSLKLLGNCNSHAMSSEIMWLSG